MKAICKKLPKTILVFGFSGSGKDTQIDKLLEKCDGEKIGTGEMFREEYDKKTEIGLEAFEYWGNGKWCPDEMVYRMFEQYLKKYDESKIWFFSQVVRTPPQVPMFDELMEKYNREVDLAIYFELSEEAAIERMSLRRKCPKCGRDDYHLKYNKPEQEGLCDECKVELVIREDDHPEQIRSRLNEFNTKTRPVLDVYDDRGVLLTIDASPSIEEIHQTLIKKLDEWTETK